MVSIPNLLPFPFPKSAVLAFFFLGSLLNLHAENFQIVDALIRAQNYLQAQNYLSRISKSTADRKLYQGLISFCLGEFETGLDLMKDSYSQSKTRSQFKVREHLANFFQKVQIKPETFFELKALFFEENEPDLAWKQLWALYLFDAKKYTEIIEIGKDFPSAVMMNWVYKAYRELGNEDQFFSIADSLKFSPPTLIKEYLRLLLESGRETQALRYFDQFKNRQDPWIPDLYLLVGTELNQSDLQITGYLRKIALSPVYFENYRSLSALYYELKMDQKAEEVLLGYLQKYPQKYQGAREIAEVFVDHGRLNRLYEFIKEIRKELRNPLALHDLALYAYSIRKDYQNFFLELTKMNPRIDGKIWGKKIVDSFQRNEIGPAFENFKQGYGNSSSSRAPVLFHMVRILENPEDDWIDQELNLLESQDLLKIARQADQHSLPDLLIRILGPSSNTWSDQTHLEERRLLGKAYASMGKFKSAFPFLKSLPDDKQTPDVLADLLNCAFHRREYRSNVPGYFDRLKLPKYWKMLPKEIRQRSLKQSMEVLIIQSEYQAAESLKKSYPNLLSRDTEHYLSVLRETLETGKAGFMKIPLFLSNRIGSPDFPVLQELYMLYLDIQPVEGEAFFPHFISINRHAYLGDPASLSQSIHDLRQGISSHWIEETLGSYLLYHESIYHQLKGEIATKLEERKEARQMWENTAFKLFEEFPDSLYTPRVVSALVESLEREDREKEKRDLIQKYLLRTTSDLLAQRLRNLLL